MTLQKIGRYQIKAQIGRGGMATVYSAFDPRFERDVAIKVLPREFLHDPTFASRFEREAKTIAALEHSAIVPVHDFGEHEGQPYLVMRYMPGGSLTGRIQEGQLSLEELTTISARIASALDVAHDKGIIHRDVKPSNILFDAYGEAFLSDFGIVKLTEATAQLTRGGMVGTPAYMAPEMARPGGVTPLIDIYALGVTLFQALTAKLPYEADTPMGLMMAHVTEPIPDARDLRPDLPGAVQAIIERAMEKSPDDRYQTAGELAAALSEAVQMGPVALEEAIEEVEPEMAPPAVYERPPTTLESVAALPEVAEEVEPVVEEVEPIIPIEEPEPTPPAEPTPAIEAPPIPEVTPAKPAQRGLRPAWIVGGVVGLALCGLLVIGLALGGVFRGPAEESPAGIVASVRATATLVEPTQEPTEEPPPKATTTPTATERPTVAPTASPVPLSAILVRLTLVTGDDGTADNLQLVLSGPGAIEIPPIELDNPGDLQPFQEDVYEVYVDADFCDITWFEITKLAGPEGDDPWYVDDIFLEVDGDLVFFDRAAEDSNPFTIDGYGYKGGWSGVADYKARCGG